jgi:hypothetical protein
MAMNPWTIDKIRSNIRSNSPPIDGLFERILRDTKELLGETKYNIQPNATLRQISIYNSYGSIMFNINAIQYRTPQEMVNEIHKRVRQFFGSPTKRFRTYPPKTLINK